MVVVTDVLGRHTIDIFYDGLPISGSPFVVNVQRGCNPKKCRALGTGLERGVTNKPNTFIVETKGKSNQQNEFISSL